MTPTEYITTFEREHPGYSSYPINYQHYIPLNKSRFLRSVKQGVITQELTNVIRSINEKQDWVIITEPWCGDAANIAPIIDLMAEYSGKIDFEIELRDGESHLIDSYLTNSGKSIPKLIARDEKGQDVFVWGPRPAECQSMIERNKECDLTAIEKKMAIQVWYNENEGVAIQQEIRELLQASCLI